MLIKRVYLYEASIFSGVRKGIDCYSAYRFFRFFLDIDATKFEGLFCDVGSLPLGIFWWLQCNCPSHLVY